MICLIYQVKKVWLFWFLHTLNPDLANPNVGLKMQLKNVHLKVKVEVNLIIFNPTIGFFHIW